ncbi:MAG TPA: hypothetical protein VI457_15735, partial [Methylococcaceae bacterium]|nr:hypothetical protein [Methylococcaceae bacterium]
MKCPLRQLLGGGGLQQRADLSQSGWSSGSTTRATFRAAFGIALGLSSAGRTTATNHPDNIKRLLPIRIEEVG